MPAYRKFLIGLAAALLAGWISHGPLGRGDAFIGELEMRATGVLRRAELPGVRVRFARDPLARQAILSGPADDFQREGQGLFPGINDRIAAVPGVAGLRWEESACCAEGR